MALIAGQLFEYSGSCSLDYCSKTWQMRSDLYFTLEIDFSSISVC